MTSGLPDSDAARAKAPVSASQVQASANEEVLGWEFRV